MRGENHGVKVVGPESLRRNYAVDDNDAARALGAIPPTAASRVMFCEHAQTEFEICAELPMADLEAYQDMSQKHASECRSYTCKPEICAKLLDPFHIMFGLLADKNPQPCPKGMRIKTMVILNSSFLRTNPEVLDELRKPCRQLTSLQFSTFVFFLISVPSLSTTLH